jgi:hypothetical protein
LAAAAKGAAADAGFRTPKRSTAPLDGGVLRAGEDALAAIPEDDPAAVSRPARARSTGG